MTGLLAKRLRDRPASFWHPRPARYGPDPVQARQGLLMKSHGRTFAALTISPFASGRCPLWVRPIRPRHGRLMCHAANLAERSTLHCRCRCAGLPVGLGTGGTTLGPGVPKTPAKGAKDGGGESVFGRCCCCFRRWCVAHSSGGQGVAGSNPASPTNGWGSPDVIVAGQRAYGQPDGPSPLGAARGPGAGLGRLAHLTGASTRSAELMLL